MGEFGWAYISCDDGADVAVGPTGSLQFHSGSGQLSGSASLVYLPDQDTLNLSGTLNVSGTINANEFNVNVENKTVVNIDVSGSTKFGDSIDDTHVFTGSVAVSGGMKVAYNRLLGASYTVKQTDYILGISSSAYVSLTLPSASVSGYGKIFIVKDEWGGFATGAGGGRPASALIAISASSPDKIDGNGNYEIKDGNNAAISLYSNGANGWFVF
jgi:hypothetical protein